MSNQFDITALQNVLNYRFQDPALALEAMTHPSVENQPNYQRLEFLGDRILGLEIAAWLYQDYPAEREGVLSRKLTALVRKETLAEVCVSSGLAPFIVMNRSAKSVGGKNNPAILSDVVEAILAAMHLDGGEEDARSFIRTHWKNRIHNVAVKDPKTALQEFVQKQGYQPPQYTMIDRTGPDHAPSFVVEAEVDGLDKAEGVGPSKKQAEYQAASHLLAQLTKKETTE